jgi:hypothetical protein
MDLPAGPFSLHMVEFWVVSCHKSDTRVMLNRIVLQIKFTNESKQKSHNKKTLDITQSALQKFETVDFYHVRTDRVLFHALL